VRGTDYHHRRTRHRSGQTISTRHRARKKWPPSLPGRADDTAEAAAEGGAMTRSNLMIGGDWHPLSEPHDEEEAANRAGRWAGLIDLVMELDEGFGFVCAAVEHFSRVILKEEPNDPWAKFAEMLLSQDEDLQ